MFIMILNIVKLARGMILINSKKVMRVKLRADRSLKNASFCIVYVLFQRYVCHELICSEYVAAAF